MFGCELSEFVHIGVLKGKIKEMKMRNKWRKYEITYLHALEIGPTYHRTLKQMKNTIEMKEMKDLRVPPT